MVLKESRSLSCAISEGETYKDDDKERRAKKAKKVWREDTDV